MPRFHVNSETGNVGECNATTADGCPFGGEDGTENHADSVDGARKIYEDKMSGMTHKSHKKEENVVLSFSELGQPSRRIANPHWRTERVTGSDLGKIRPQYTYLQHYIGDDYKIIGPAKTKTGPDGKVWQVPVIKDGEQHIVEIPTGNRIPITVNSTYAAERRAPKVEKVELEYGDKTSKRQKKTSS